MRAWSRAAPFLPSSGTRRVLTRPGTGARAKTTSAGSAFFGVASGKLVGRGAQPVGEPQPPHEDQGAQHATPLPAPARSARARGEAGGRRAALHELGECDVLHECDLGK